MGRPKSRQVAVEIAFGSEPETNTNCAPLSLRFSRIEVLVHHHSFPGAMNMHARVPLAVAPALNFPGALGRLKGSLAPLAARAPYAVIAPAAVGLLPSFVRRDLRLPLVPIVDPLVVRPAAFTLMRAIDWVMAALPVEDAA